ncbi:MAG TPA: exodeoxyribonuclease III [bacterium]|nr:exodeoxyribonuclease III [bacterium]HQL63842.1 exodeoxyribonuclease III [bacterium]
MKLISWNINGIRAVLAKGFLDFVKTAQPDVLCLQETRATPDQVDLSLPGYFAYWNPAEKKGYSGTAVFTKQKPLSVFCGINKPEHNAEGRVITLEFPDYYLVNVYTPNAGSELERLEYRTKEWDPAFLRFVKELEKKKPVIFCGDLNVAHKEIDLADPKGNEGNAGFTLEERAGFDRIIQSGFIDTFREFTKEGGHYTWWSYKGGARAKNLGWRIDYFCISPALRPRLMNAAIHADVTGSDHCPISIDLK